MKKIFHYFLAFLIPVLIFLFAMYLMDLYPFGDTSIRISDANIQYPAFFEGLKDGNLFTFKIGLGANFYTIWTTYLASPFSLLYFFFENYQFDIFFVILILLKIGLIGLNMNILLNYKKEINKNSLIFSTIYALSGFVTLYYWNYQFLDALYMLPLVMIGIEKIVNDNKNTLYFITLTLTIIFHYYTAYMVCIFSVIYFFFLLINSELQKKEKKKRIFKFFITSLFCGLASSFVLIPSIYSFMQGRLGATNDINYFGINKDFFSFFYNLSSGSSFPIDFGNFSAPVFITLFIIVLLINHWFDKNISNKYKISLLGIVVIYLVSLLFNCAYFGWHLFNIPQGLPGRFVFCFNCFFVLVAYKEFFNINSIKLFIKIIISFVLIILMVLSFFYKINAYNFVDKRFIILLLFSLLLIIYYIFLGKNKKLFVLTVFLLFLELLINLICSINVNFSLFDYNILNVNDEQKVIKDMSSLLKKEEDINKGKFYRNEFYSQFNYGMFLDFNAVSYYSSVYNKNLVNFLDSDFNKYSNGNINYVVGYSGHFLFNGLISLNNIYEMNDKNISILNNKYFVNSVGYMIKNNDLVKSKITNNNIIDVFNNLVGDKKIEYKVMYPTIDYENVKLKDNMFELINKEIDGRVIINYKISENSLINLNIKDIFYINEDLKNKVFRAKSIVEFFVNNKKVKDVLYLNKGDDFKLIINLPKKLDKIPVSFEKVEYVNYDDYKSIISELNKNIIKNIKFNPSGFTGNIIVSGDKNLMVLTIPYDKNFSIYINNKKKNYKKIYNGIIGFDLENGEYKIELKYRVNGLKMGIIISINTILIFSALKILEKKYNTSYNNSDNKEEIFI